MMNNYFRKAGELKYLSIDEDWDRMFQEIRNKIAKYVLEPMSFRTEDYYHYFSIKKGKVVFEYEPVRPWMVEHYSHKRIRHELYTEYRFILSLLEKSGPPMKEAKSVLNHIRNNTKKVVHNEKPIKAGYKRII